MNNEEPDFIPFDVEVPGVELTEEEIEFYSDRVELYRKRIESCKGIERDFLVNYPGVVSLLLGLSHESSFSLSYSYLVQHHLEEMGIDKEYFRVAAVKNRQTRDIDISFIKKDEFIKLIESNKEKLGIGQREMAILYSGRGGSEKLFSRISNRNDASSFMLHGLLSSYPRSAVERFAAEIQIENKTKVEFESADEDPNVSFELFRPYDESHLAHLFSNNAKPFQQDLSLRTWNNPGDEKQGGISYLGIQFNAFKPYSEETLAVIGKLKAIDKRFGILDMLKATPASNYSQN